MDPIADMFSAMKNAIMRKKDYVDVPSSKQKEVILDILKREGYIRDWERIDNEEVRKGTQYKLRIYFKYLDSKKETTPISDIVRVSKPGKRVYMSYKKIPYVKRGLGIAIVSTDAGIVTDHEARKLKKGGEIIAYVW